jgi:hypothetical protein
MSRCHASGYDDAELLYRRTGENPNRRNRKVKVANLADFHSVDFYPTPTGAMGAIDRAGEGAALFMVSDLFKTIEQRYISTSFTLHRSHSPMNARYRREPSGQLQLVHRRVFA